MMHGALLTQPVPGFESTAYVVRNGAIVWLGDNAVTEHPRNGYRPWQPPPLQCDAVSLQVGAGMCLEQLAGQPHKGLLLWLMDQALPFPLNHAQARFDAIREAFEAGDCAAFEAACLRVLGLGHGLTPSGDDFVGGILFALHYAPRPQWHCAMPGLHQRIGAAAQLRTNAISAALLDDLMRGASYGVLHSLLAALQRHNLPTIQDATEQLLRLGASSGADMLAGLLLALTTTTHH